MRVADGVADRPHLDPGSRHVQQEIRNALALRGIRVGAGQQQAPVGVHAAAGPQLLPVDDVAVAVPARRGPQARQIRSGFGFGESLNPDLAVEDGGQMPAALLVGARRRAGSTRRDGCRRTRARVGAHRGRPAPGTARSARRPACRRPTRAGQCGTAKPARMQFGEPRLLKADEFLVADPGLRRPPVGRDVLFTPGPHGWLSGSRRYRLSCVQPRESVTAHPAGQCVAGRGQPER